MKCTNGHIVSGSYCFICEVKPEKKKPKAIRKVSVKNSFKTSEGERVSKAMIDARVKLSKAIFRLVASNEGKDYCGACGTRSAYIGVSHIVSVNDCQNDGMTEYAWDTDNMQLECNSPCHIETETRNFDHHANARYKNKFIEEYNLNKTK